MVKLPDSFVEDQTLIAMEMAVEAAQDRSSRPYLGASEVGHPCARRIWYNYNNYPQIPCGFLGLAAAESGHYAEAVTASRLRLVDGITLITHNTDGTQLHFSDFGGKFKGHMDGLIFGLRQAPKTWHVWEHKDKDHTKYQAFINAKEKYGEKDTLKNWDYIYYIQAQMYMHYYECTRHYMTVTYAGGRKYQSCRTEYEKSVALQYIDRAKAIIEATNPPQRVSEQSDYYLCRFCPFRGKCHGG